MSLSRENPLSTEILGRLESEDLSEQLNKLHMNIKAAADSRSPWIEKQERLLRQRRGIRRKKLFPFPGSANFNWPLTDGIIRRWKPGMSNLVVGADPVTNFIATKPEGVEVEQDAQAFYNNRFYDIPNVTHKALLLTDWIGQHGRAWTRQGWTYKTRKSCRVVRADSLFPGGPQAAHERARQSLEQQRQQAIEQGVPEEELDQIPSVPELPDFVRQILQDEYQIGLEESEQLETLQLEQAVQKILQGAKMVKFYYQVVESDRLAWEIWNPMNVIYPPRARDEEDAEFICWVHHLTADDIRRMAADGHFDAEPAAFAADKLANMSTARAHENSLTERDSRGVDAYRDVQDTSEGIEHREADASITKFEVWEIFAKLDMDGDGIREKVVIWLIPSFFDTKDQAARLQSILAMYPHAMPFEEWPAVAFDFEKTSDRPFSSRGIAEMVSVFQAQVNALHNARLDSLAIVLSPMFTLRASGPTDTIRRNIRYMPGTIIPLPADGEFAPVQTQASDIFQSLSEENFTRSLAEQYIGVFDPGVLQQNAAERRTATEVDAVLSQVNSIADADAKLFQANMAKVHRQLWKLQIEFGPEEIYFRIMGEEQPRLARKSEIDFEYEIIPAGTPTNTSKQLIAARAREALQMLFPDQTGLINKRELYRWFLSTIDNKMQKRILRSEQDAAAIQAIVAFANEQAEENGEQPAFESF